MTTQPKAELSLAEQEAISSARVIWAIAIALVVGFVALFAVAVFKTPKYTSEEQKISRGSVAPEVYSAPETQDVFEAATKNVAKRTIKVPARAPITAPPASDLMTVVPPKHKRPAEPLTPAELEFAKLLADFERKIPK